MRNISYFCGNLFALIKLMTERRVRVRFAPSPTGPLHIGGVRTALYNYLYAKKKSGDFILRIEDTDSQRYVEKSEEYIITAFEWLGLSFDEGPHIATKENGGPYGPYRQSERKSLYRKYVDQLLDKGLAYIAFDTPEELNIQREKVSNFQYDASTRLGMNNSLTLPREEVDRRLAAGDQYVVRIRIEAGRTIVVNDLIRGEVVVNSSILDDKVLFKSADNLPTYHLANIVDDHLMEISHVIRGEEWLPSAPLHVILYEYLGWKETMPHFAHLPLLLKPEGNGKLSKRDGDRLGFPVFPLQWEDPKSGEISSGYREAGYFPEAVINFLALLGWNPGDDREILSLQEMIDLFSLERCSKSGAKFDYKKGEWFNHKYLQLKTDREIAGLVRPLLAATYGPERVEREESLFSPEKVEKIAGLIKERLNYLHQFTEETRFFFEAPEHYDQKVVKKRWKQETPGQMRELIEVLDQSDNFSAQHTEEVVKAWIESKGYSLGGIMNAFRLALVGESKGPHIYDIIEVLGRSETIKRLNKAIDSLS